MLSDHPRLELAIEQARLARAAGNHPFGAVLADAESTVVLSAQNTVVTESDVTGHAESNLVRLASRSLGRDLRGHALYTSTEPCAMCAGAIYWAGISKVVFALAESELRALTGDDPENPHARATVPAGLRRGTAPDRGARAVRHPGGPRGARGLLARSEQRGVSHGRGVAAFVLVTSQSDCGGQLQRGWGARGDG
jgi:tRNA(Arg) A34 adenosine deaminase TadA